MTKTWMTTSRAIALTLMLAPALEAQPTAVSEANFEPKSDALQLAPAGVAVVRPTHFPEAAGKIKHLHQGDTLVRTVGRNVTLRDLLAEAYDCPPGCIVLPPDAAPGGYDFLVTLSPKTRHHLREAITKELGYTATAETRTAQVLVLTVQDPALPGLKTSTATDADIEYRDGRLYFTGQPLSLVVKGLEDGLALPIVDQTGLTNSYDFSIKWSADITQAMRAGAFELEGVQKALGGWGLELKPGTARLEMFTVKKTHP